ncbi:Chlorophyll a-b binding protein 7, chloroplastic, partial [Cucurbita argyrosperma subsp. sororia]
MASACASSAIAAVAISSSSSQKNGCLKVSNFLTGKRLRLKKYTAAAVAPRSAPVCAAADPDRPLWFPGSTPPPWLDGSLPGDFGFDPLGLCKYCCMMKVSRPIYSRVNTIFISLRPFRKPIKELKLKADNITVLNFEIFKQAELVHCRWAMLGAAGIFIPEFLTKIGILNTPSWYTAGELEYFTDTTTLFIVELIFIGWAEGRRWADILKPGCVNTDPIFPNNKLTGTDVGYPGGLWFDPLGWGSGSPEKIKELRTKEIKNGRLAMLAVMGAWFQHIYTGTGPIDNLFAHLADPGHATVFAAFTPK